MIKSELGKVTMAGSKNLIKADFCCIVNALSSAGHTEQDIHTMVKEAFEVENYTAEQAAQKLASILADKANLLEILMDIIGE